MMLSVCQWLQRLGPRSRVLPGRRLGLLHVHMVCPGTSSGRAKYNLRCPSQYSKVKHNLACCRCVSLEGKQQQSCNVLARCPDRDPIARDFPFMCLILNAHPCDPTLFHYFPDFCKPERSQQIGLREKWE